MLGANIRRLRGRSTSITNPVRSPGTEEHIIKNEDGAIGERNTYGNDPRDIPG